MSANGNRPRRAEVLILTAISLEYEAAKQVRAGAWKESQWEEERGPNGLPVAFGTFRGKGGQPLRVALALAEDMGAVAATNALLPLVETYQPRCVAMCGVCAGRPGKANLGDVIAAERLFFHDTGKKLPKTVQQDIKTYNLRGDWKVAIEQFDFTARFQKQTWWKKRPIPYAWQQDWVLAQLQARVKDPSALPESKEFCPQWEKVIASLWKSGLVKKGELQITAKGRERIREVLTQHRKRFPDVSPSGKVLPFKVHVAPMGSGNQVVEDKKVWSFVSESMRKTLGLEMEAAALGALAHAQRDRKLDAVVMKGVMDFANHGRDDHFKHFAARASAECLLAFLREHVEVEIVPDWDDLLVSGTEEDLPKDAPPSALLNARYEVVPFHERGREPVLAELDRWCDESTAVAARLLHAEGGVGKTRLAIEWIQRLRRRGWAAGFLPKQVPEDWFGRLWALGQPVLVAIEYAESRSDLSTLLERVQRYAWQKKGEKLRRMRILLLARNDGDWWQSLKSGSSLSEWLGTTPPYKLEPLATNALDRETVFREAAERFARLRGKTHERRAKLSLADPLFERVLYLHMAALASVEGLPFEASTLMDAVLDHEERFWETCARQDDLDLSEQRSMARQLVAAATLRGGFADLEAALGFMERNSGHSPGAEARRLARLLHRIYQHARKGTSSFLPALEPDLLGEGVVLRVASPPLEEDRLSSHWIDRVFPPNEGDEGAVELGLTVLGRASVTQPDLVRPWIERILKGPLRPRARLALNAAKAVGQRTAFSVLGDVLADRLKEDGDAALARELDQRAIPFPTVSLNRVIEWVGRTLLGALPESEEVQVLVHRARALNSLSLSLSGLGRREEALRITREAVEIRRSLAQRNPEALLPELAKSLANLGVMSSEVGRHEEALAATSEAAGFYRELAQRNPEVFEPELAAILSNWGAILGAAGRREEALETVGQAAELYRALARRSPGAFQAEFAGCLTNLGLMLSGVGRNKEALEPVREAVELRRLLARRNPDGFQPHLAKSLTNLGLVLSASGSREESVEATREGVELYRSLARRNSEAFEPEFARSLANLGGMLSEMGHRDEALQATREATGILRALAQSNREAFQGEFARSLSNLGVILNALEHRAEALEATAEAVELRRELARSNPAAFQSDLIASLNNLGAMLGRGDHEEALKVTEEAVQLSRGLARLNPEAFRPQLATSLHNLGIRLGAVGRWEDGMKITGEAIEIRRGLAQRSPDAYQPDLASSLNNLGIILCEMKEPEQALSALQEALDMIWPFFERLQAAFEPRIAALVSSLRTTHEAVGRAFSPTLQERLAAFERLTKR